MDINLVSTKPEVWGGVECTINRIADTYRDQLFETGYYSRGNDLTLLGSLNIKALRYPILWEHYQPTEKQQINWSKAEGELKELDELKIRPIAGLLHHGSGPAYSNLLDDKFASKFSSYALKVASRFPQLEYYSPVNEPLTTARFSGLYALWYPHRQDSLSFVKMLINQLKGVVLAMKSVRTINPDAKLIQTEDLGKVHSTTYLKYQADFENERRWLSFDLLCGLVKPGTSMWEYFISIGIAQHDLEFFVENVCTPHVLGLNYYVTSERYLDEQINLYPHVKAGGNGIDSYVDVEAYRHNKADGLGILLAEAWNRYHLPIAITESHLACTREEQMRWLNEVWTTCCTARKDGINVEAVTAWALLGSYDWDSLLTKTHGHYEVGAFDIRARATPRPTAVSKMISSLAQHGEFNHPLLNNRSWWHGENMFNINVHNNGQQPLLIIGKHGTLATAFSKVCHQRGIFHISFSRHDIDISNFDDVTRVIEKHKPWGVINTSGYVEVDKAESQQSECFLLNASGPEILAKACREKGIPFMTFSSDQVFGGDKKSPYEEGDSVAPLNHYGVTKAQSEVMVAAAYPASLIIRTSAFFGPWDNFNFAHHVISALENKSEFSVASDVYITPTYVPHLVQAALDLFIDQEESIWHLSNKGSVLSWADFAHELAARGGYKDDQLKSKSVKELNLAAKRPMYSALQSGRGVTLPTLDIAIGEYFNQKTPNAN